MLTLTDEHGRCNLELKHESRAGRLLQVENHRMNTVIFTVKVNNLCIKLQTKDYKDSFEFMNNLYGKDIICIVDYVSFKKSLITDCYL